MPDFELFIRNADRERVAQVDRFERLEAVSRWNDVGSFILNLPYDASLDQHLGLTSGIQLYINGEPDFSGQFSSYHRDKTPDGQDKLTLGGFDDNKWFVRRVVHPEPTNPTPPYNSSNYNNFTGLLSSVLFHFVDYNMGPSALSTRRVPGLMLTADPGLGASTKSRGRWQVLLTLLQSYANLEGLGFKIEQDGTSLEFSVYEPRDLTSSVIFSGELGNLAEYSYELVAPATTYVFAGGTGSGTSRKIKEGSDAALYAIYGRSESFVDASDTNDNDELRDRITDELANTTEQSNFSFTPLNLPTMNYGTQYRMGDKVTAVIGASNFQDNIREISRVIQQSQDGTPTLTITPTVGTPNYRSLRSHLSSVYNRLTKLDRRIQQLERV